MRKFIMGMMFAFLLVYVVSPVDCLPGPIDDIFAILLFMAANRDKIRQIHHKDNERIEVIDVDGKEIY